MNKFLVFVLIFCFLSTQSFAANNNGMKEAFDEINYALTVEWDQNDIQFFETAKKNFSERIKKIKDDGATNEEIIHSALLNVHDPALASELRELLSLVNNHSLSEEMFNDILSSLNGKYGSNGASWNGRAIKITATIVIVVLLAAVTNPYYSENANAGENVE